MDNIWQTKPPLAVEIVQYDAGLKRHMIGIYRIMALGLVVTGAVAFGVANTPALAAAIFGTPLKWVAMLAPLAFVMLF